MMERVYIKQIIILMVLALAFLILVAVLLHSQVYGQEWDDYYDKMSPKERRIAREMEKKYLTSGSASLRFWGDTEIDEDEIIKGDVMVAKGTLEVAGEVEGQVIVMFGDVDLDSTCLIDGDVISVGGKVWRDRGAVVIGDVIETSYHQETSTRARWSRSREERERHTYVERRRKPRKGSHVKSQKKYHDDADDFENSSFYALYNRVDGLSLGLRLPPQRWWEDRRHNFAIYGFGAFGFASKNWHYQIGLERWVSDYFRLTIGGEVHDLTDTQDRWVISDVENSLAAFFLKEDYHDYYSREGLSGYVAQNLTPFVQIRAEYHRDDFRDLEKNTNWSLFGGKKVFRSNPYSLPTGFLNNDNKEVMTVQSGAASFVVDSRNEKSRPTRGWYLLAYGERAGHEFESDMEFERFMVDLRRYQPLGWDENIDIRLRAGSSTGVLPPMYWFDLGGISTLRGARYKEFTGDRMVLANVEYRLNTGSGTMGGWFVFDDFDVVLFIDSGYAWFANGQSPGDLSDWQLYETNLAAAEQTHPTDGFDDLTLADLKTCVGIGLSDRSDNFRINFAKRTDVGGKPVVVTVRIKKPF